MSNYIQLKNQIEKLQKEADALRKHERTETIARIKEAIVVYELTAVDLGLSTGIRVRERQAAKKKSPSPSAKYRSQLPKQQIEKNTQHKRRARADKRSLVAPKYRDIETGNTWTGRGKQPKWLTAALKGDKKLEDFKI